MLFKDSYLEKELNEQWNNAVVTADQEIQSIFNAFLQTKTRISKAQNTFFTPGQDRANDLHQLPVLICIYIENINTILSQLRVSEANNHFEDVDYLKEYMSNTIKAAIQDFTLYKDNLREAHISITWPDDLDLLDFSLIDLSVQINRNIDDEETFTQAEIDDFIAAQGSDTDPESRNATPEADYPDDFISLLSNNSYLF